MPVATRRWGKVLVFQKKLSQDPLDECFSKGGVDKNLTLLTFDRNFLGLNVAGNELISVVNSST